MTTKDYKLIASIINNLDTEREHTGYLETNTLVNRLSKEFALRNPRFDEDLFKSACYGK
jgi:hypothetical protein